MIKLASIMHSSPSLTLGELTRLRYLANTYLELVDEEALVRLNKMGVRAGRGKSRPRDIEAIKYELQGKGN